MATLKNSPATAGSNPADGGNRAPPRVAALESLFKQFESCRALMTEAEVSKIDEVLFSTDGRRTVQAGHFTLTHSGRRTLDDLHGDPQMVGIYKELAGCASDRAKKLRGIADGLDRASARLELAWCGV